jgi:hypothetical protein
MNQLSNEVVDMCTYFVHKINIMIHVLNNFNCKMIQISQSDTLKNSNKENNVGQTLG